ncbi:immunoglobulin-like domain-containing protein, partial [Urechidicola sp. KH5]
MVVQIINEKERVFLILLLITNLSIAFSQCLDTNAPTITLNGGTQNIEACISNAEYCASNGVTNNTGTTSVQFNSINNSSASNSGYADYTGSQSTSVMQGSSHQINVNVNTNGNWTSHVLVWIDWDQNNLFDDGSYDLGTATNVTDGITTLSGLSITVPMGATLGTTRMRVTSKYNVDPGSCDTGIDGEVEDYTILVMGSATASDICDGDITGSIVIDASAVNTSVVGSYPVYYDVVDSDGNSAPQVTRMVDVVDTTIPTITLIGATPQIINNCGAYTELGATANDPCFGDISGSIVIDASAVNTSVAGSYTVYYDVVDTNGNSAAQVTRTVNVVDNTDPVARAKNITISLDASGNYTLTPAEVDNGSSDACGIASMSLSKSNYTCADIGKNKNIILTVTDNNGNVDTDKFDVTVVDDLAPTVITQNVTLTLDTNGNATLTTAMVDNGSWDNCGIKTISLSKTNFDCDDIASNPNTVTLWVRDDSNTWSSATAQISVVDTTKPTINLSGANPQNVELCGSYTELGATVNDNCTVSSSISIDASAVDMNTLGTYTVTYDVTDDNGNVANQVTRTVNVVDTTAPIITITGANPMIIEACSGSYTELGATANDLCFGDYTGSIVTDASSVNTTVVGSYPVYYDVTDAQGNFRQEIRTVNVVDTTIPTLSLVGSNTQIIESCGAYTELGATASDPCFGDITGNITVDTSGLNTSVTGSYTVYYNVDDAEGNPADPISRTVNVIDTTNPTVTTQDITVTLDNNGNRNITAAAINNGSFDACGIASISLDKTAFTCSDITTNPNVVTLTVTDNNGLISTGTANVTVEDTTNPVARARNVTIPLDASGNYTLTPAEVDNGSSDACGIASMSLSKSNYTCADIGKVKNVILTVTDNNGNVDTDQFDVTVIDNLAPTVITQSVTLALDANGNATLTTAMVNNGSWDNCGIDDISLSKTNFDCDDIATSPNTVTLWVKDDSNNWGSATAQITVVDATAPAAPALSNITWGCAYTPITPTANDVCDGAITGITATSFPITATTAVTWTFTDSYGNSSNAIQTITITAPVACTTTVVQDVTCAGGSDGIASVTGSGGVPPYTYDWGTADPNALTDGTHTVTVYDSNGCSSTCDVTINAATVITATITEDSAVTCNGGSNGQATVTPSGGNSPYAYLWSNGETNQTATSLEAGLNTVTITDNTGCSIIKNVTINEPDLLVLSGSSTTAPSSVGVSDGTATFGTVTGGTAPYEYSIDGVNWFSTTTFTGLQEAPFKFYVRDSLGCFSEERVTGYFNLAAGACVIDMGNDSGTFTPTEENSLWPYGLIYELVETHQVPVYWVINPNKSFVNDSDNGNPNIVNQIDITVTGTTTQSGVTPITRNLQASPFIIPEQYLTPTVIAELQSWEAENNTGVNIHWNLNQLNDVPVYGVIKTLANTVIHPLGTNNPLATDIGQAFFGPARIPATSFRTGRIDELNGCDEIYVMGHHSEPDNWSQNEKDLLYDYVLSGGNVWMGCQDVSRAESIITSNGDQLNFLSDFGLIAHGSHGGWSNQDEVAYTISTAGNPIMQFIGEIHPALEGGAEHVYLPKKSAAGGTTGAGGWLPTTVTAIYDTNQGNIGPTNTSNGNAAILAYGPAFGNSLYGTVVYEGSHINSSNAGNAVQHIGERRVFGNYLLTSAIRYQKDAGEDQKYEFARCGRVSARLNAEQPINGGGVWSIVSGAGGSFADVNNPKSRFYGVENETYELKWSVECAEDTVEISFSTACSTMDFDGVDDDVTFGNQFNRSDESAFSFEIWVKPNSTSTDKRTIFSKRDGEMDTKGYDLSLVNNILSFNWNSSGSITSPYPIGDDRWYHVAVTFDGSEYIMYVDGIEIVKRAGVVPTDTKAEVEFLIGAMDMLSLPPYKPVNHFHGWVDEFRIWNVA